MSGQRDLSQQSNLLRQVGEAVYGPQWQSDLSDAIGVSDRSLRRWAAGTDAMPEGAWRDIHLHAESRWRTVKYWDEEIIGMLSKGTSNENNDPRHAAHNADLLMKSGCQYYATARFAMEAQRFVVCGNLFHLAVEMLLKGGLAKDGKRSLAELKNLGHRLWALWCAYKADHPGHNLDRHDKTIKKLDKFEDIRYPDPSLHSIGVHYEWSEEPPEVQTFGGLRTPKRFVVVVGHIDDLVADVFRNSSWNPGVFMGTNEAALEAVRRNNKHANFLTMVIR